MTRFSWGIAAGALILAGSIVSAQAPQGAPPQGGGAPPQGGGAPPQGGGAPPQGGGAPPQGGGAPPQGAGGAPQPPMTNLQVFPKDTGRPQVLQAMQAFSAALGVTCVHCHVFNGPGDPMNDFASDTKPTKNVARAMMRMVREINPSIQKAVPAKATDQVAAVGCATCHRGKAIPVVEPGSPGAPPPPRGAGPGGPPAGAAPAGRGN